MLCDIWCHPVETTCYIQIAQLLDRRLHRQRLLVLYFDKTIPNYEKKLFLTAWILDILLMK